MLQLKEIMTNDADRGLFITEGTMIASLYNQRCKIGKNVKHSLFHDLAYDTFTVLDGNGDNLLDKYEYARLFYNLHMDDYKTVSKRSFCALDTDRDGYLTRSDYIFAFRDYFFSDDPSCPGTLLFGPFYD